MSSVLLKDAMTESYLDLEDMIRRLARKWSYKYRHDQDDLLSLANEAFVESFGDYNPRRGTFASHVYRKALSKIQEFHRTYMRRRILGKVADFDASLLADNNDDDWMPRLMDNLSKDGKKVAELTIEAPKEVIHAMRTKGDSPAVRKRAMTQYLSDLGWTTERVLESFSEITEALRC